MTAAARRSGPSAYEDRHAVRCDVRRAAERPPPRVAGWKTPRHDTRILKQRTRYAVKRAIDYAAAAGGLCALSPLLLAIALAIRLDSDGGALFMQERVGRGGRPYKMLKFRTMRAAPLEFNADGSTRIAAGDARVTRVGRLLRGALDELPQLFNVLRGEMSLVGPRPDLPIHTQQYTEAEWRKLDVLPGLTGLATVMGRNAIPWKTRIAIDLRYVEAWSLTLDAKILAQTFLLPFGLRLFDFRDVAGELADRDPGAHVSAA